MKASQVTWRTNLKLIICLFLAGIGLCSAATLPVPEARKLAVLLNYAAPGPSVTAEDLVQRLSSGSNDPLTQQLVQRFQRPLSTSLLLSKRLPTQYRATLPGTDPDELLHRYMVLEYASNAATLDAKAVLQHDPLVLYVKESTFSQFSAAPADPLYPYAFVLQDYQWAINDPMNLQGAWNTVRGTAYLAHLDNGIQTNPLHEDLGQPWRRPEFNFNVAGGTNVDENPATTGGYAGHGTHTAGIMAAATSQSSVLPGYPNPPAVGGAGVCWYCTLMVAKISRGFITDDMTDTPNAINWAVSSGAQAVNMSFGTYSSNHDCQANPNDAFCLALGSAAAKEVVLVAAAGNSDYFNHGTGSALGTELDFPAASNYTIAVGAIQAYSGVRGNLWTEESPLSGFQGSSTGSGMETHGILAPGRDVLSTFYYGFDWNPYTRCGTSQTFPNGQQGTSKGPNYGICTGTSMATPHITGIVGLLRSVNPLLDAGTIRSILLGSGNNAGSPDTTRGYGVPNAAASVNSVLGTTNRLTPLLSLYSNAAWDHFYTVVPQMARASIAYGLVPYAGAPTQYQPYGTTIAEYASFAQPYLIGYAQPRAQVWVFSTHVNPFNPSVELMPLYRLSWKCGDPGPSVCGSNSSHVSHFYTTSLDEAHRSLVYYAFDGIEGYVHPVSLGQPSGTTFLMRAYNADIDDYAVFPQEEYGNMASQGYTLDVSYLGYAYLNSGSRPSY